MAQVRFYWVDWMKVIGMFLIIWGHLFPKHSYDFIYSFNVPLFFCISGFLGGGRLKLKPLMVPYLIICATYLVIDIPWQYKAGDLSFMNSLRSVGYMLAGFQRTPHGVSAAAMWFVYTLAICKVVHYFARKDKLRFVISIICLVLVYATGDNHLFWSFQNVLICYPFYFVGTLAFTHCQLHIQAIEHLANTKSMLCISMAIVLIFTLSIIAPYNGFVMMYQCGYGNNLILFLLFSFVGISAIFLLSVILEKFKPSFLIILSSSSIVILAYHYLAIRIFNTICKGVNDGLMNNDVITFFLSLAILLLHIPIIKLVSRYFSVILGGRKI